MKKDINEIIDYAIEQEKEAALFYRELKDMVKNESSKKALDEFEQMEWGHAEVLQDLDLSGINEYQQAAIPDLKISDYMLDKVINEEMSFQDVLVLAMKREEAAKRLYEALADKAPNQTIKNTFLRLAEEESKHKLEIEAIYDKEILYEN